MADTNDFEVASKQRQVEEAELAKLAEGTLEYAKQKERVLAAYEKEYNLGNATVEHLKRLRVLQDEAAESTKNLTETRDAAKKSQDDFSSALGNTIKTFTGITDSSNTLIGSFLKLKDETGSSAAAFKKAKEQFSKTFTTLNVGLSIVQKVTQSTIGMAIANDSALASFNKSTGAAGHYNDELIKLEQTNRATGISTVELGDSYSSLMSGVSGFGIMAQSQRMELGELSAQYGKVGVASSDFAGILQSSTNMMGLGAEGATQMQSAAFDLAQELGRNVSEVFSELNQALPKLALYSGDVTEMFGELQEQAHETGMAVGELMDMAGAYRTFDSAAEAAGNLNAVLGTQLFSTMGMLEAQLEGPAAVMEYMTENLSNSIGDWNTLNTFQKEAVANAANMSVESMATLMNQRDMTAEQRREAVQIEEAMATARSMGEEMKILMAEFAVAMQPIFNFVKGIVSGISAFLQVINTIHPALGGLAAIAIGMLVTFGGILLKSKMAVHVTKSRTMAANELAAAWNRVALAIGKANAANRSGATPTGAPPPGTNVGGGMLGFNPAALSGTQKLGAAAGIAGGALGLAGVMGDEGRGFSTGGVMTGAASGASTGAGIGAFFGPGGAAIGGAIGAVGGGLLSWFADGTDSTPQGPAIVGERGPELLVPPPGSAVVNNSSMTALANGAGGGNNAAVVAAVRALGAKMDTMITKLGNSGDFVMQVNSREFGRVINEHLGEDGYQPLRLKTV